jgi:hypothetical protein
MFERSHIHPWFLSSVLVLLSGCTPESTDAPGTGGTSGNTGGTSSTGGTSTTGGTPTSSGGKATGGSVTASGGTPTSGGMASGGKATGGAATGGKATGGTATGGKAGVVVSPTCPQITWPSSTGNTTISGTQAVSGVYDGGMRTHEGTLNDCTTGDQSSTTPIFEVANGGTVRNVIMGSHVGDGIHCLGSCTIENVWFPYICDDAISALGSGTVTIRNSGFKNARDKTIQHNGSATVNIDTVYVETAGKLYRSCGTGCSGGARTANISNVVAIGVSQVAGASTSDTVTLKNICTYRTPAVCNIYEPGSDTKATTGVNSTNDGPNANCKFTAADVHALVDRVTGTFTTEALCGGLNGYKGGSMATSCVSGFDTCLKMCMPGGYGFKQLTCTGGLYAEGTTCAMPTDSTAATNLAGTRVSAASSTVTKNDNCSTQWALGLDSSNTANYCVCVKKPGYYSFDNWLAWDCQSKWW